MRQTGPERKSPRRRYNGTSVRAFVAIVPDPPALEFLRRCHARLLGQPWAREVRWVEEAGWHATLRFLGEISPDQAGRALAGLAEAAADLRTFDTVITGPRFFPSAARPRVVAAILEDEPELRRAFAACESVAAHVGVQPEGRDFHGHITYGRCLGGFPRNATPPAPVAAQAMAVRDLILYRSELTTRGAKYTPLGRFALGRPARPSHSG